VRVLLVTDWTANEGGIEAYVIRAANALRSAGHEVRLLTSSLGAAAGTVADYVAFGTDNAAAQTFLQIANPFAVARVRTALRDFKPDVVQVNMFEKYLSPAIFPALRRVPTVVFVHYYKPICPTALKLLPNGNICLAPAGRVCWQSHCVGLAEWLRDRPRYGLIRSALSHAQKVLACSQWMVEQLSINGIQADAVPLPVPSPPVDFQRIPSIQPHFLYCGRLDRVKGVDLLLRAFQRVLAKHPSAVLEVVGDGPRRSPLEALASELGLSEAVRFSGRLPFSQVEAALSTSWALVAPSLWPEPLGLVAIEAVTRGIPAIASASGGFAETIADAKTGYLVPSGNEQALAECLASVAERGPMTLPSDLVQQLQQRHDAGQHARMLEAVFRDAIQLHGESKN
jgi:glycosyltransferase involved in cell wall biosynthesis